MENKVDLEICVGGVHSALEAEAGGADRVELCDNLVEGGTTPSAGMITVTRAAISITLHVIIRPRGGDYHYSPEEIQAMKHDIRVARELGADGVVIGLLDTNNNLDIQTTRTLIELARPMSVTFHRAFDEVPDAEDALQQLMELGVNRLLTSGHAKNAFDGLEELSRLQDRSRGVVRIMPAAGIHAGNIAEILRRSGVRDIHVGGAVRTRKGGVGMHGEQLSQTDRIKVRALIDQMDCAVL
jgi:copper homeostasis protein